VAPVCRVSLRLGLAAFGRNRKLWVCGRGPILPVTHIVEFEMPPVSDWRSAAAYAFLNDLNPGEFAWEFLRRNPEYQRDYRAAAADGANEPEFLEALLLKWGLRFPDRSGSSSG